MRHCLRLFCFSFLLILSPAIFAAGWSLTQSTPQPLWGIAQGNGLVIAVGEQGSILSGAAASGTLVWSPRVSGTTVWLTNVGYGNSRWVAVGDLGTIITSDDNGVTWTARVSNTTSRLNAVCYGNNLWLAVGENGSVLSSPDATTWTVRPSLSSGYFRGLGFGQGRFLFGGAGGALYTTTNGVDFSKIEFPSDLAVEAVVVTDHHFWVSGGSGFVAVATRLDAWEFSTAPADGNSYRGLAATDWDGVAAVGRFSITRSAAQWTIGSLPNDFVATSMTLFQQQLIATGLGGIISTPVTFLVPAPEYRNVVEGSQIVLGTNIEGSHFQWYRNDTPISNATGPTLTFTAELTPVVQSYSVQIGEGPVYTLPKANLSIVRAGRPAVVDPLYHSALPGAPSVAACGLDYKTVVAGPFLVSPAGGATYGLARLNTDGSLDSSFRAGSGLAPFGSTVFRICPTLNFTYYLAGNFSRVGGIAANGVVRLKGDGSVDPTFSADPSLASVRDIYLDARQRLYVRTSTMVVRLRDNGLIDPSYSSLPATDSSFVVGVDDDGNFYLDGHKYDENGHVASSFSFQFEPHAYVIDSFCNLAISFTAAYSGATEAGYPAKLTELGYDGSIRTSKALLTPTAMSAVKYDSSGGLWVVATPRGSGANGPGSFYATRYLPGGVRDATIYATLPDLNRYSIAAFEPSLLPFIHAEQTPQKGVLIITSASPEEAATGSSTTLLRLNPLRGEPGRLSNLSIRAHVDAGSAPFIMGFVCAGYGPTQALVRAAGPALASYGVSDGISDPRLTVVRSGITLGTNDDWNAEMMPAFTSVGAFPLDYGSKDAALQVPMGPGNFSALVTSGDGTAGTVLTELYEAGRTDSSAQHFINGSALGTVSPGRPLIVGFVIAGKLPLRVLLRGVGPGLAGYGVNNLLLNPTLSLHRGAATISVNDNWPAWESEVSAVGSSVGAFTLGIESLDSAMVATLAPGVYSAVVEGVNNSSGNALVEIYEAPAE